MRWSFALVALSCWQATDAAPQFTLQLSGAVSLAASGRVEQGSTGRGPQSYYTITLGGREGGAAVVFTRRTPEPPTAGRYLVGEGQLMNDGFSALIITGPPSHPTGVFEVQHGVLRLAGLGPDRLAGEFELHAAGFLEESPGQDDWELTARGRFTSRTNASGSPTSDAQETS